MFNDEELVGVLRRDFVNVAVDVDELQTLDDPTGDFFRHVVLQRRGINLGRSTQGHYIFNADGDLLRGSNSRDPETLLRHLRGLLLRFDPAPRDDPSSAPTPTSRVPSDVTIVELFTRVVQADWPLPCTDEERIARGSVGRDFLWITAAERDSLTAHSPTFPASLARRIARFHLVDNSRCSPLVWNRGDLRQLRIEVIDGGEGLRVGGHASAETEDRRRGYEAHFGGDYEVTDGELTRFNLTIKATFHGDGKWSTGAPPGEYVVAIAFRMSASPVGRDVIPGSADRIEEYLDAPCSALSDG